jgi:RimJ/RimL family protein N-acetyltransferase
MWRPVFPLPTARLLLRPFTVADLDSVWAYQRLPEVARHLLWEPRDRGQVEQALVRMSVEDALIEEGDCVCLAVLSRDTGVLIGQVELVWRSRLSRQGEVGYLFHPAYGGRGLATEAALALIGWGFDVVGLHRITGRCAAGNSASAALLTRVGMRQEAHLVRNAVVKGEWRDELVYAMLRPEWRASRGGG